jgi:hypothetical protein
VKFDLNYLDYRIYVIIHLVLDIDIHYDSSIRVTFIDEVLIYLLMVITIIAIVTTLKTFQYSPFD